MDDVESCLLRCPEFSIRIEVPGQAANGPGVEPDWSALPARPGVFALEDDAGRTIALATTANLRRMIQMRLEAHVQSHSQAIPEPPSAPLSPKTRAGHRADYRGITRTVLALPVGSAFEADWVYLHHARHRVPAACRALLDRWQPWFVHCDPAEPFPQWVKTPHPGRARAGATEPTAGPTTGMTPARAGAFCGGGVYAGPMPDKHAAGRYLDILQDAFDLCRYHHILVQSPRGRACAYKEMGKCPAPCDGSVSMDHYRSQIMASIEFATMPIDRWRADVEASMRRAADAKDYETAAARQRLLAATKPATTRTFAHVRSLADFRFLVLCPSVRRRWLRLFVVNGGWIEPLADFAADLSPSQLSELLEAASAASNLSRITPLVDEATEGNIALVSAHLFRPAKSKTAAQFIRVDDDLSVDQLRKAIRRMARDRAGTSDEVDDQVGDQSEEAPESDVTESAIENLSATVN